MKLLRSEKGLTLVELVATLAIASLIIVFIMSIHVFVQKQYQSQKTDAQQLTDIMIAVKEITRDIRMYEINEITETKIAFKDSNIYEFENNILKKNNVNYIYEMEQFKMERIDDKIILEIESTSKQKISTEIMIR